eukprot:768037-Hanusia_phi.AAC.2
MPGCKCTLIGQKDRMRSCLLLFSRNETEQLDRSLKNLVDDYLHLAASQREKQTWEGGRDGEENNWEWEEGKRGSTGTVTMRVKKMTV